MSEAVYDVAVVGAGPAGATAAFLLARRGLQILLIEKQKFPRAKVCGCCLNQNALATLERAGLSDTVFGGEHYDRLRLMARGRLLEINLPPGRIISRSVWDTRLVEHAVEAGAEFRSETTATLEPCQESTPYRKMNLRTGENRSTTLAKIVLAADGLAGGLLSRTSNIHPNSRVGAGAILEAYADWLKPRAIHMVVGTGGYVGLAHLEDGRLDLAAALDIGAIQMAKGIGPLVQRILHEARLESLDGIENAIWKGTPPLTRHQPIPGEYRVFAIGDAAGYVEPFTGEGMAWALASAIGVHPLVLEGLKHWEPNLISKWSSTYRRNVSSRQFPCRALGKALRYPAAVAAAIAVGSRVPVLFAPVSRFINRPTRSSVP